MDSRLNWCWMLLAIFALLAPAAPTEAQATADEEARALFEAGRASFSRGRYEQALEHFQESYRLSGRPALLYNIGTTHDRLRQDNEALEAFRAYLDAVPNSDLREEVEERVRILEQQVTDDEPDLSPEAVAAASPSDSGMPTEPEERESITRKWWFWTIIGVVVVGAAVGIGVGASGGGTQGPQNFDANTVVISL